MDGIAKKENGSMIDERNECPNIYCIFNYGNECNEPELYPDKCECYHKYIYDLCKKLCPECGAILDVEHNRCSASCQKIMADKQ